MIWPEPWNSDKRLFMWLLSWAGYYGYDEIHIGNKYNKIMHQKQIKGISLSAWMYRILGMWLGGLMERLLKQLINYT